MSRNRSRLLGGPGVGRRELLRRALALAPALTASLASLGWAQADEPTPEPTSGATPTTSPTPAPSPMPTGTPTPVVPRAAPPVVAVDDDDWPFDSPGRYLRRSGALIEVSSFYSTALRRTMPFAVLLPPGYELATRRYAVLFMLHGLAGGYGSWLELGLHETFETLYAQGRIDPFIVVLVEGEAGYYVNHADGGPAWGDYVAQDVLDMVDEQYRTLATPASRAVGGLSMGGEGALQLALNHPGHFEVVGAHTPTTRLYYGDAPGNVYGDYDYWQRHNALWLIQNRSTVFNLLIWIDDGYNDVWLPAAESLHDALLDRNVAHQYHIYAGGHDYWVEALDDYLRFYSGALETGGPDRWQPSAPRRSAGRTSRPE